MNEHCRAPNSGRGFRRRREFLLLQSLTRTESLTTIRAMKRALTYGCSPENQAQMPRLSRVRAITANGSGGSQIGMECISNAAEAGRVQLVRGARKQTAIDAIGVG